MSDGYNWKISFKKFIYGALAASVPVILQYTIDFLNGPECPPDLLPFVPLIVGIVLLLQNYFKHKDDE